MNPLGIVQNYGCRHSLSIRSLNVCSLRNKIQILEAELTPDNLPDVICIQESWLKPSHSDNDVKINGYSIVRCDRPDRGGGGVAF